MMSRSKRLGALDVDREIVVDEEDGHLTFFFAGAGFEQQQFVDDALVGAEADGVAEESGDGAKLAAVGATASGLDGDDAECSPAFADFAEHRVDDLGQEIELVEIDLVPGDDGIFFQRRLAFFSGVVDRGINFFELAASGIVDHLGPGLVGFAEGDGVGVARSAIAAEGFVGEFGDVRSAHDDFHPGGADGVGDAIGLGDHAGHGADADEVDFFIANILGDLGFVHGLGVAVDQQDFVAGRSEGLEEKHPEVRHEVASHTIVGVIEKDSHDGSPPARDSLGGRACITPGPSRANVRNWEGWLVSCEGADWVSQCRWQST